MVALRAAALAILSASLFAAAPLASANHMQMDSGNFIVFDHMGGNEWWVEAGLAGQDGGRVASLWVAQYPAASQMWVQMTWHADWGKWTASTHVTPGNPVKFRAMWSGGAMQDSCWFSHPDGAEACGGTGNPTPFDAGFTLVTGNEWWVQTQVTPNAGHTVDHVEVRIGEDWKPLRPQGWGVREYAASYHIPEGTLIQFRASDTNGLSDLSGCYRWIPPQGNGQTAPEVSCSSPPAPAWYNESFWGVKGNEWWVEARVDSPVSLVEARAGGGEWHALTRRDWGAWAASFHVPAGSLVQFRAHRTDGAIGYHAQGFPWPDATPPYPGWGNGGDAFHAAFHNTKGNLDFQQVNVYATWNLDGVQVRVYEGTWVPMQRAAWGDWTATMHLQPGDRLQFKAIGGGGEEASQPIAWPPTG